MEIVMADRLGDSFPRSSSAASPWLLVTAVLLAVSPRLSAQAVTAVDPGVRGSTIDAGGPLPGLSPGQMTIFPMALLNFNTVRSINGSATIANTQEGLGPRYNSNSCGSCHSQPAIGGSSPSATAFPMVGPNPQVTVGNLNGGTNQLPYFVTANGPVREARFRNVVRNGFVTSTPDGGVHDLFTVTGRTDAINQPGATGVNQTCTLAQPDFDGARRANNISFRIPTPVFGAGLIEAISDGTILANQAANASAKRQFRISGHPNRNGNDGTITKFGWKAQNATLFLFAGEAYNVEMGVTNEIFAVERTSPGEAALPTTCIFNQVPEDSSHTDPGPDATSPYSDIQLFAMFMEMLAPPAASTSSPGGTASIQAGETLFRGSLGCALCHTPTLMTSVSPVINQGNGLAAANLFSDLLVHNMGDTLADGVSQGLAGPEEFRTAPLWGLGQRVFFLHDGRTTDLVQVIRLHGSSESEARVSSQQFFGLSQTDQQNVLNFLRSL
jgi:CxxC motif-containing protein (DUF1111 family)